LVKWALHHAICPQARAFLKKWALSLMALGAHYFGETPALGHYPTQKEQ